MNLVRSITASLAGLYCAGALAAADGALKSLAEISAPHATDNEFCYDAPRLLEQSKRGRNFVFVQISLHARINGECSNLLGAEGAVVHERIGDEYREMGNLSFTEGSLQLKLFSYGDELLLAVDRAYFGTGNFHEYELLRVTGAGTLEAVPIRSPAELLKGRTRAGQWIVGPALDFEDERMSFAMQIANGNESNRFPTGGSALGAMQLVRGPQGLELVPVPDSLQLPGESSRFNRQGLEAYRLRKYEEAASSYRKALELDHANFEAMSNLGLVYLRQERPREAIEISLRVVEATQATAAIRAAAAYNAGRAHESLGERTQAAQSYATALDLQASTERRAALERVCPAAARFEKPSAAICE